MPNPIPPGYHSVTPYLVVADVSKLMNFLTNAFGATERGKLVGPNGSIAHAEMWIGDSIVMMGQPESEERIKRAMLHVYVPDVDATYKQCLAAGGVSAREPQNQFYSDRSAMVLDPCGNEWHVSTHVEDVSPEEMERRMAAQPGGN
jgi:PhnB protein